MSAKSIQSKNTGGSVVNTTFDCCCGLKINRTCPKEVALKKRLHLSKCEQGRIAFEAQKAKGELPIHKFTETVWNVQGGSVQNTTVYTHSDFGFGGKCIRR